MFTESGVDVDLTYVYYVDVEDTDGTTGTFDITSAMTSTEITAELHARSTLFMIDGYAARRLHAVEEEL